MRNLLRSAALITTCLASPVLAENAPVVVELYTSQGCSSCPPADDILTELALRDDVIALALHVDYWDYIGWVDDFADPSYTRRQQNYARAAGETTIYTPQFVVGGKDLVIGARPMQLSVAIQNHSNLTLPVNVTLTRDGTTLSIAAELLEASGDEGPFVVQLARVLPDQSVAIHRGENAGETITYSSVVRSLDTLDDWDGAAPFALDVDVIAEEQVAVIIQQGTDGRVVGAAKLK